MGFSTSRMNATQFQMYDGFNLTQAPSHVQMVEPPCVMIEN